MIEEHQEVSTLERLPLSYSQKGLWFLDQLGGGSAEYNTLEILRLTGVLDFDALERAVNTVVSRHESLRTCFLEVGGEAFQVIHPEHRVVFDIEDLSHLSGESKEKALQKLVEASVNESFDLCRPPLFRFRLAKLSASEHVLIRSIHHIITDGWSNAVFTRELTALFESYSRGGENPLPDLTLQYGDFALWQKEWLDSGQLDEGVEYWKRELSGLPDQLELPADRARPEQQSYIATAQKACLSKEVTAQLRALTQSCHATLFMTLLSSFFLLLARYCNQQDVVVGTPVANRQDEQLEDLIGFFVNMLVLRIKVEESVTFRELVKSVRSKALAAYSHQDVPFERIVEELQPERKLNSSPLFQVLFAMQNAPWIPPKFADLRIEALESAELRVSFDLELHTWEHDGQIWFYWLASRDLFDSWRVGQMVHHMIALVEAVVAQPDVPLREISFLQQDEVRLLLPTSRNKRTLPRDRFAHELFEEQARCVPSRVAVKVLNERWTYAQVNRRADQIAACLSGHDLPPESVVGVFLKRCPETVACFFGVLKAGMSYLPLDPDYPAERLHYIMNDSRMAAIIITAELLSQVVIPPCCSVFLLDETHGAEPQTIRPHIRPESAAYLIYTSGSSGVPKGVVLTHAGLCAAIQNWEMAYHLDVETSVHLQLSSAGFDVSIGDFTRALCFGKTLLICPTDYSLEANKLFAYMQEHRVDALECVPALARNLLDYVEEQGYDLHFLELFILGADVVSATDIKRLSAACGPQSRIINSYGLTECTIDSLWYESRYLSPETAGSSTTLPATIPIGRALINTDVYILDPDLRPVPYGVVGELYIGGETIARGYKGRPALTAERFIANPYGRPGERLYRTGDLVRRNRALDIEFAGRADDQIKLRGFRIELGDVEGALRAQADVLDAAVILNIADDGERRLVGYIVEAGSDVLEETALKRQLEKTLPLYMIPAYFVRLSALPRNPNGKLDRSALPRPQLKSKNSYQAPRNPRERILCDIFAEVLGLETVGIYDNFFEKGGHSLLAMRIVSRVRKLLRTDLSIRTLFQAPSIAELVPHLGELTPAPAPSVARSRPVKLPLSYAQGRFLLIDQLEGSSPEYNILDTLRLRGPLVVAALERALNDIVRRHESLRTHFELADEEQVQVVRSLTSLSIPFQDLSSLGEDERTSRLTTLVEGELESAFSLQSGPLFRVKLVKVAKSEHILITTVHHIIWDAWSDAIFKSELAASYSAQIAGSEAPLPELTVHYADFAVWERRSFSEGKFDEALHYWKLKLTDAPIRSGLTHNRPHSSRRVLNGGTASRQLSQEAVLSLNALARDSQASSFMILLSVFGILLSRYNGQNDLIIGSPIANRFESEFEPVIGCFVNMLALRLALDSEATFTEYLAGVRDVCLDAYRFQAVPFERVVEQLQLERIPGISPLFQVLFTMHNVPSRGIQFAGLDATPIEFGSSFARYEFALHALEAEDATHLSCHYNRDLFSPVKVDQVLDQFIFLVEQITASPQTKLGALKLFDGREEAALMARSRPSTLGVLHATIDGLFEDQVRRTPQADALVCGTQRMSYTKLDEDADSVARYLRSRGIGPESVVALAADTSSDLIVCVLGVLKAGAAYLPLNTHLPMARAQHILSDAGCILVLTSKQSASLVTGLEQLTLHEVLRASSLLESAAWLKKSNAAPGNAAYVLYTSGSSGTPKGVIVEHTQVVHYVLSVQQTVSFPANANYAMLQPLWVDSSVTMLYGALLSGGCLHLLEQDYVTDANYLCRYFQEEHISCLKIAPSHLLALQEDENWRGLVPNVLIVGGEESRTGWLGGIATETPGSSVWNHYGPTETTVGVLMYPLHAGTVPLTDTVPLGLPLANSNVYVLDANLAFTPAGAVGELYVSGMCLARGYLNQPGITAAGFVADPFQADGSRMYRTGDLVRRDDDGNLLYIGRNDDQIKLRGFRIELKEVESVLRTHPAVREAVVFAFKDDEAAEKRIVGYVVPYLGAASDTSALLHYVQGLLPEYMVPSVLIFVDAFPRTQHGKLDRQALPKPHFIQKGVSREPRSQEEQILCRIFSEISGVGHAGIDDSFFSLGGHSLMATRIVSRIRKELGVELRLRDIFYSSSIEGLASVVVALRPQPARHTAQGPSGLSEEIVL